MASQNDEIITLKSHVEEYKEQHEKTLSNLAATQKALEDMEAEKLTLSTRLEGAQNEFEIAQECIRKLKDASTDKEGSLQEIVEELTDVKQQKAELESRLQETQVKLKSIESQLLDAATEKDKLTTELKDAKEEVENMEEQLQSVNNELEAAHATIWGQSEKAKSVDAELVALRGQLTEVRSSMESKNKEYESLVAGERDLQSTMDIAGKERDWYKSQYNQAQDRIEQLEEKLVTSRREVAVLEVAKQQAENRANKLEDDLRVAHDNMEVSNNHEMKLWLEVLAWSVCTTMNHA